MPGEGLPLPLLPRLLGHRLLPGGLLLRRRSGLPGRGGSCSVRSDSARESCPRTTGPGPFCVSGPLRPPSAQGEWLPTECCVDPLRGSRSLSLVERNLAATRSWVALGFLPWSWFSGGHGSQREPTQPLRHPTVGDQPAPSRLLCTPSHSQRGDAFLPQGLGYRAALQQVFRWFFGWFLCH